MTQSDTHVAYPSPKWCMDRDSRDIKKYSNKLSIEIEDLWHNNLTEFKSLFGHGLELNTHPNRIEFSFTPDLVIYESDSPAIRRIKKLYLRNNYVNRWQYVARYVKVPNTRHGYFSYRNIYNKLYHKHIAKEHIRDIFNWIYSASSRILDNQVRDIESATHIAHAFHYNGDPKAVVQIIKESGIELLSQKRLTLAWEKFFSVFNINWWFAQSRKHLMDYVKLREAILPGSGLRLVDGDSSNWKDNPVILKALFIDTVLCAHVKKCGEIHPLIHPFIYDELISGTGDSFKSEDPQFLFDYIKDRYPLLCKSL